MRQMGVYVWVAPNTLLGFLAGALVLGFGGRLRFARGVVEFSGGALGVVAGKLPRSIRFSAMTLGHVILGIGEVEVAAAREHEHVHVRQYESWGPLFLFAYAASSIWQVLHGRHAYSDNFFERQAYAVEEPRPGALSLGARQR
jgi:hypothetical protein